MTIKNTEYGKEEICKSKRNNTFAPLKFLQYRRQGIQTPAQPVVLNNAVFAQGKGLEHNPWNGGFIENP